MPLSEQLNDVPTQSDLECLAQELMSNRLSLGENVANTSRFMKSALAIVNANFSIIQTQLERLKELAADFESSDGQP